MTLYAKAREYLFPGLSDVASSILNELPDRVDDELVIDAVGDNAACDVYSDERFEIDTVSLTTADFAQGHSNQKSRYEAAIQFEINQANQKLNDSLVNPTLSADAFVRTIQAAGSSTAPSVHHLLRQNVTRCRGVCAKIIAKRRACPNRARVERELEQAAAKNARADLSDSP